MKQEQRLEQKNRDHDLFECFEITEEGDGGDEEGGGDKELEGRAEELKTACGEKEDDTECEGEAGETGIETEGEEGGGGGAEVAAGAETGEAEVEAAGRRS